MRTAQPCARRIVTILILERALKHEDFLSAPMLVRLEPGAWSPADQGCAFCAMLVQGQHAKTRHLSRQEFGILCVDDFLFRVGFVELVQFHEDCAAIFRMRCVFRANRIADISSSRVITMLVRKDSIEDEELFAATMSMLCLLYTSDAADD